MGEYQKEIRTTFYEIFNENSKGKLINFFKDPVVQFLWSIFSEKHGSIILPGFDTEPIKRRVFLKEIEEMECITGFKILQVHHANKI